MPRPDMANLLGGDGCWGYVGIKLKVCIFIFLRKIQTVKILNVDRGSNKMTPKFKECTWEKIICKYIYFLHKILRN